MQTPDADSFASCFLDRDESHCAGVVQLSEPGDKDVIELLDWRKESKL